LVFLFHNSNATSRSSHRLPSFSTTAAAICSVLIAAVIAAFEQPLIAANF
jgi:hypothetical protein